MFHDVFLETSTTLSFLAIQPTSQRGTIKLNLCEIYAANPMANSTVRGTIFHGWPHFRSEANSRSNLNNEIFSLLLAKNTREFTART